MANRSERVENGVALGGTGYAAFMVTGKNVKNGSLTGSDVVEAAATAATAATPPL